ncbi:Macrophage mannose receptor 1 [Mizuhopecten yessoensis]|uniref:Macrophage mannose receptor 1 n=1 Tax=Mizuhopecten yessoensis TaxID=6573 RepID=A0A210Q0S4_MIZYE|nr:Macrophage mannose receptor 1 [Mizuhopecten yessoensis]
MGKSDIMCHPDGHWSTPLLTCTFCDPGNFTFEESLNFCYMVENTTTVIYDDAKTHCSTIGGKLAKLDSPAKVNFMVTITSNASINNIFYVDGNDRSVETVWVYDDGTPVDMALFSSGRPFSNNNTNDCVAFHKKYKSFIDEKCGKIEPVFDQLRESRVFNTILS